MLSISLVLQDNSSSLSPAKHSAHLRLLRQRSSIYIPNHTTRMINFYDKYLFVLIQPGRLVPHPNTKVWNRFGS